MGTLKSQTSLSRQMANQTTSEGSGLIRAANLKSEGEAENSQTNASGLSFNTPSHCYYHQKVTLPPKMDVHNVH